jgi:hypothetical protein
MSTAMSLEDRAKKPTKAEWRFERFKERLGTLVPSGLTADGMTFKKYGPTLLQVLKLAVEKQSPELCRSSPCLGFVNTLCGRPSDGDSGSGRISQ